jgi:hypothetical protein
MNSSKQTKLHRWSKQKKQKPKTKKNQTPLRNAIVQKSHTQKKMSKLLLPFPQKFFVAQRFVATRPDGAFSAEETLLLRSLLRQVRLGPASENRHLCANAGWFSSPGERPPPRQAPPALGTLVNLELYRFFCFLFFCFFYISIFWLLILL